ncbi:SAM-dependent methyltransferase [Nonomuraea sp. NPDC048882]|uniref:SAM-dependent methyltransferase n=1 Tax=Nonomuraea sp. NPDC048882 TaxID=3154347 RepID=UPI0033CCAD64
MAQHKARDGAGKYGKDSRTGLDADLLGHRAKVQPPAVVPAVPNVARMYDVLLGGKDNYACDRAAVQGVLRSNPAAKLCALENRAFLCRVVRFLAGAGIRQFLDIGSGFPGESNVHEVAQREAPDALTVYVDYDPVVLTHARALLATDARTVVVCEDMRRPEEILAGAAGLLDWREPVAVLLVASLHFVTAADDPYGIVATLMGATVPGSYLVVSHVLETAGTRAAVGGYEGASAPVALRTPEEIARFFGVAGTDLVEPGLVRVPLWRPEMHPEFACRDAELVDVLGGVGRRA